MIVYLGRTFCVSPNCENKCGRRLTEEIKAGARAKGLPLSCGYFCGKPDWYVEPDASKKKGSK